MSVLARIQWAEVNERAQKEVRRREVYSPVISLFRWWARRPHTVAGAILDAAIEEFQEQDLVVSDPFSGGGTVTFEAARRGLSIYAQDLYPWPSSNLALALTEIDPEHFERAAAKLLESLTEYQRWYWRIDGEELWETNYVLRVRKSSCPGCTKSNYLFKDLFLTVASLKKKEIDGFYGCKACGTATRAPLGAVDFICAGCNRLCNTAKPEKKSCCPHCQTILNYADLLKSSPQWHPLLIQECNLRASRRKSILRPVQVGDPCLDINVELPILGQSAVIPDGKETRRLLANGFHYWDDLYTKRQRFILQEALNQIQNLQESKAIKDRLAIALLGACEMPGYLCRWERKYPKAIEAMANHHYSSSTIAVETNLLGSFGRGTFARRLLAVRKALDWSIKNKIFPKKLTQQRASDERRSLNHEAIIVTGSSTRQVLMDQGAHLVLTDPPYHDDLQYGELARLFHFWMDRYFGTGLPDERYEAVSNYRRENSTKDYEDLITGCLSECRRTLATKGRLILTYHNNNPAAWDALRNALVRSKLLIVGLATVASENSVDQTKRDRRAFLYDLVVECVKNDEGPVALPIISGAVETVQQRNLLAMGLALAQTCNVGATTALKPLYLEYLQEQNEVTSLIR